MAVDSELIDINITVQDVVPATSNFGIPLICAYVGGVTVLEGVHEYDVTPTGLLSMIADGIDSANDAYLKVAQMAAQQVHCAKVKVYSRPSPNVQIVTLTFNKTTEGYKYQFSVDTDGVTTDLEYTVLAAATATTIATAIQALLDAIPNVTATDNTGSVSISPTDDSLRIYLRGTGPNITVLDESVSASVDDDLTAALAADADFFGVLIDSMGGVEIAEAAAWCETNKKQFYAQTADSECADSGSTTDVLYVLEQLGYHFTEVFVTRDMIGQIAAGAMARDFAWTPGASVQAWKTIVGTIADVWSGSESTAIKTKSGVRYQRNAGVSIIYDGWAVSGRYVDLTRGQEWLKARIGEAIHIAFANREVVPMTDSGASYIESAGRGALAAATGEGRFLSGYDWSTPKVADIPAADRIGRVLPNMTFEAYANGAIQSAKPITGSITL